MEMDHGKLVPQRRDLSAASKTYLTASQRTLAVQIHLTSLNAKSEMEPELVAEFDREFSACEPEAIEWAFAVWRRQSKFNPAISEIWQLVKDWERGKREQKEIRNKLDEKFAAEEGRKQGLVPEFKDVVNQLAELANKMAMPEHVKKLQEFKTRNSRAESSIPAIASHLTPDQIAARLDRERAEIERYKKIEAQRDGNYGDVA